MDFANQPPSACLLVDNGSLQPESTLTLRRLAETLGTRLGRRVEPVSLLHSRAVAPVELEGHRAETLEAAIRSRYAVGIQRFFVIPLFFGPSGALADFVPKLIHKLAGELPGLRVAIGEPLAPAAGEADRRVSAILAEYVRRILRQQRLKRPAAFVVDHGSPRPEVAAVRDRIARQVAAELGDEVRGVIAASMERRPGAQFGFSDPLLDVALRTSGGLPDGDVIAALMFFSPGRHAGPGGDIERICRTAEQEHPGKHVHLAPLVSEHPLLIDILADRYAQLIAREPKH